LTTRIALFSDVHGNAVALEAVRAARGMAGGAVNASTRVVQEELADVGAEIRGSDKFGPPGGGPWRVGSMTRWVGS